MSVIRTRESYLWLFQFVQMYLVLMCHLQKLFHTLIHLISSLQ